MKKHLLLLLCLMFAGIANVNAQCTPDPNHTTELIYPTSADTTFEAIKDSLMEVVFTLNIPQDTLIDTLGIQINGNIDSVRIDSVSNMPGGVSYECSEPNCSFPGGASYCVKMSGAPDAAGTYNVEVAITVFVSLMGVQQELTYIEPIPLIVSNPDGIAELSTSSISIFPQPAKDQINFVGEEAISSVTIYDLQGRIVLNSNVNGNVLSVSVLENGNYIMLVNTVDAVYSQPIVILK